MTSGHEDEVSRSIPGRSGQTIGAVIDGTGQTVEEAVETVCAATWCYSRATMN